MDRATAVLALAAASAVKWDIMFDPVADVVERAYPVDGWSTPWREQLEVIGKALRDEGYSIP